MASPKDSFLPICAAQGYGFKLLQDGAWAGFVFASTCDAHKVASLCWLLPLEVAAVLHVPRASANSGDLPSLSPALPVESLEAHWL
jgi:hypothetical protein